MLKKLRLGNTWISHEEEVDLPSDLHSIFHFFRIATDHQKQECLLDLLHTKNFWANSMRNLIEKLFLTHLLLEIVNLFQHLFRKHELSKILFVFLNAEALNVRLMEKFVFPALLETGND